MFVQNRENVSLFYRIKNGEYKNCRIPVDKPISPVNFVKFIMEHFYYVPSAQLQFDFAMKHIVRFDEHLEERDRVKSHIVV
ncbi:DUF2290 domain-containing protein [Bariatricus sp. SGI.154]|uniref:DUF2290 domain-containing protein n=1 Tax=Bariatricus sp. SGI.154 TaxID=3420549 RepID=UPI003D08668F